MEEEAVRDDSIPAIIGKAEAHALSQKAVDVDQIVSENKRLAALADYGILDTPREAEFDDIVRMAAEVCGTPIALLNLIDSDRQWFKAEIGLGIRQMPINPSICVCALSEADILQIPDLAADPRFADSPLVTGPPYARFYAGVPLKTASGLPIGVLCVVDRQPGCLTSQQGFILRALARTVMAQLEQRKAIAERTRAENYNRLILDSAIDYGIISFDLNGRVTQWNEGARRIFGWTEQEILGQPADRIFTPEDVAADIPATEMGNALRDGRGIDERWHLRKDGTRFFASGEMMALRQKDGPIVGFIKVLRDRTEQRKAGRLLRDSQSRVEIAEGTGLIGFFNWDVQNDLIYADQRFAALYGLDPSRLICGMPLGEIATVIHPDDRGDITATVAMAIATGENYSKQFRIKGSGDNPDRHLLVQGRCYERDGDRPLHYTGVAIDISPTKDAEAALRISEARYRALFDSIDQGFCIVEVIFEKDRPIDYRFFQINAAFERQTGLADVTGRTMRSLAPDHEQHWFDIYGRVALTGESTRFEQRAAALDRWYDVFAFRIDAPETHHVAILFKDITEDRRIKEALADSNSALESLVANRTAELQMALAALRDESAERARTEEHLRQSQKMEAVGQLTGGLAHDFNNLLTGITGSLELLEFRLRQGRYDNLERFINAAQGAARRAAALTHRLLAFSRRQTLDPKPTDVSRLVGDLQDLIQRTVGPAISVQVTNKSDLWPALIDPNQLENALLNLCINARDAMPDGGALIIETENKNLDDRIARERDIPPGQYLSICVSDNGSGMPPDVAARAFDPFFTTKPMGEGTGLGLSMIYGFARQSGGQVRIHSQVGRGTTVCLYLPRHAGATEQSTQPSNIISVPRAERGQTVLVVDDEPTIRMLVLEVLDELGYVAVEAADGAQALKILNSDVHLDLLVTDVGLPNGMNGRQVADAARFVRPDLKVLFITGYAENAAIGHGHLEEGMHILTKPFAMDVLANRIRDLIVNAGP